MTSEAWRHQLRAEGIERRPPPTRPDRGYIEQPGEESKSKLLIPLSVIKDEEEKAIMAELLEEERAAKAREEDERLSGIRPPLPPPPEPSAPRRRIVTRGDLRPERQPLRASLADFVTTERPAPENETRVMPATKRGEPDHIDMQIRALLAKHEAAQRAAEPEPPPPPQEHPTLLSRPQPPPPEPEPFEDYHEPAAAPAPSSSEGVTSVTSDGRRQYTQEFRDKIVAEYERRRANGERISHASFGREHGLHQTVVSRWVGGYSPTSKRERDEEPAEVEEERTDMAADKQANGKRVRRTFTDHDKLDILDRVDALLKAGSTFVAASEQVDVGVSRLRAWQEARKNKTLKRPLGRRASPEAAQNPKAPGPRSATVRAALVDDDSNEERTVGVVMAELQAAKQRVKELKAELMELL